MMRGKAMLALGVATAMSLSTACNSESAPPSIGRILCKGWVQSLPELDGTYFAVLDVVALPRQRVEMGTQDAEGLHRTDGLRFVKFGLLIRSGADVEISATPKANQRVLLEWSPERPGEPTERVVYSGCPAQGEDWLAFPGGMWVPGPGCYEVVARSNGQEATAKVNVDAPCA